MLSYVFYSTVSRAVGVGSTGLFVSLISAIMIIALPASVAGGVLSKMSADARARGDLGIVNALNRYALMWVLPVALVIALAGSTAFSFAKLFFHTADTPLLTLFAAVSAFTIVLALQRAVFQGASLFTEFVTSNVIESLVKATTGVIVWVAHAGLQFAMVGYLVAVLAAAAYNAAFRFPGVGITRPSIPQRFVFRHLVGIALPLAAITAATFSDVLLVRFFLDSKSSGLYGAAALVGRVVLAALQFVPTVLMPRASAEHAAGRSPVRLLVAASGSTMIVVTAAVLFARFFPTVLLNIAAGRAFSEASPLVLPYVAAMGLLAGATVLASYLIALNRSGFAWPVAFSACCEVGVITAYHPDSMSIIHIVLVGHAAIFLCCLVDVLASMTRNAPARLPTSAIDP